MENVISNDLDIDLGSKFHAAMNRDSKYPNLWGLLVWTWSPLFRRI
jgi:hypothetical protein